MRTLNLILYTSSNKSESFCKGRVIYTGNRKIFCNMLGGLISRIRSTLNKSQTLGSNLLVKKEGEEIDAIGIKPDGGDGAVAATFKTPLSYQNVTLSSEELAQEFTFEKVATKDTPLEFIDPKSFKIHPHDGSHLFLHDKTLSAYFDPKNVMFIKPLDNYQYIHMIMSAALKELQCENEIKALYVEGDKVFLISKNKDILQNSNMDQYDEDIAYVKKEISNEIISYSNEQRIEILKNLDRKIEEAGKSPRDIFEFMHSTSEIDDPSNI